MTEQRFAGSNFMTPTVLLIKDLRPDLAVELSTGRGIEGEPIFGVTFAVRTGGAWVPGREVDSAPEGGLFRSRRAAEAYIREV